MYFLKVLSKLIMPVILLLGTSNAVANNSFYCEGTIKTLGVHSVDKVMLKLSNMNTVVNICNLNTTVGEAYPVSSEQCKAVYSTLLTAYSLGKNMRILFDNVDNGTTCGSLKSWELATTRWVNLSD